MHGGLLLGTVVFSLWLRWRWQPTQGNWHQRWQSALVALCLPPLLLLSAAIAILAMGHHGTMIGLPVSPLGCWIALLICLAATGTLALSLGQGWRFILSQRQYPTHVLPDGTAAYCLPDQSIYAAQVGFWRSHLLISQGFLTQLSEAEATAILCHEQAHAYYRDTFSFFWLGWLRRLTSGFPKTQALWQELQLLREMRADHWAAQKTDPLLLAELIVRIAASPFQQPSREPAASPVGISGDLPTTNLEQRIEALLQPQLWSEEQTDFPPFWVPFALVLMPLITVFLHA